MLAHPRCLAVALCLAAAVPIHAAELSTPALPGDITPLADARDGTLKLTLEDAYALALGRNLDLQVGRFDLAVADTTIEGRSGIFDPTLTAGINGDYTKSPSTSALEGANIPESRNTRFNLGIGSLLPTGTQVSLNASTNRSETNNDFASINPSWYSSLTASVTQPLLDGFGTLVNRSGIVIAQNARGQTALGFESNVVGVLQTVEQAYWDLAAARAAISVREQSLELAQRLLDETHERVKVGTSAPIDLVQSEASVASRKQDLIVARNQAGNAEDALKAVLGFDDPAEWLVRLEVSEDYESDRLHPELAKAISAGLSSRPEILQQELGLEIYDLNVRLARNQTLPSLDLSARYGYSGIGGTERDTNPLPEAKSGVGDSFDQIGRFDFPNWSLGVSLSVPLGNHDAKATVAQRRWEKRQAETQLKALQQRIIREVRVAVRALEDGGANIDAAMASLELAQRNLEAEQTKFQNGLSTNYQVLQIQDDLAGAQLTLIQAYLNYRQAIVNYRVASGSLLDSYGIEIADPGAPDAPHDYWSNVKWLQFDDLKRASDQVEDPAEPAGEGS